MGNSLVDFFNSRSVQIPEVLISPDYFQKIKSIARYFPILTNNTYGFESVLQDSHARADFYLGFKQEDCFLTHGCEDFFINHFEQLKKPFWNNLRQFCSKWSGKAEPLLLYIDSVWLEFDVHPDFDAPDLPIPAVFLKINNFIPSKARDQVQLIFQILSQLHEPLFSPQSMENVRNCLFHLPDGCSLAYVGYMASRNPDILRLNLSGFKQNCKHKLTDYLKRLGLYDFIQLDQDDWQYFFNLCDHIVLNLDIGQKIELNVGLEFCFADHNSRFNQPARGRDFLIWLIHNKLKDNPKINALLSWNETYRDYFDPLFYSYLIHKKISHLKVVFKSIDKPVFKAYYTFSIQSLDNTVITDFFKY